MPKFSALILFGAILALTSEAGEIIDYHPVLKIARRMP
jgi:hypothetical protein